MVFSSFLFSSSTEPHCIVAALTPLPKIYIYISTCLPLLQLLVRELQLLLQRLVSVPAQQPGSVVQIQLPVVEQPARTSVPNYLLKKKQLPQGECRCWSTWTAPPGSPGSLGGFHPESAAFPQWLPWPAAMAAMLCLHWGGCTSAGGGPWPSCPARERQGCEGERSLGSFLC